MAEETYNYLFLVYYDKKKFRFHLPSSATVEDVKLQIYAKTDIQPCKQNITGWTNEPINEYQTLSSFLPSEQNRLWVSSVDDPKDNVEDSFCVVSNSKVSAMLQQQKIEEEHEDVTDTQACISFIAQFIFRYGDDHVPFHDRSLRNAIKEKCFASIQSRKVIALYFHNENDPFSKMLCPTFISGAIRDVLEKSYYVIGWDVRNKVFHSALKKSLNKNIDFEPAQIMLTQKRSALFIIYPIENSITIFSMLHGEKLKAKDVLTALWEIAKNFEIEIKNEIELEKIRQKTHMQNDIGSREFQQLMYDRLGDRDYDCFEYDEHGYLREKIGFATFGPPQSENGYDKKQKKNIEETYKRIRLHNNKYSEWQDEIFISFIYNCLEPMPEEKIRRAKKYPDYNPNTDIFPVPVFVIRKCRGSKYPCRIYIDSDNRVYNSWRDYIEDNKLNKCTMILPLDGHYIGKENGEVLLERHLSPTCGIGHAILKGTDIATTIAGLASGGIFIAALIPTIVVAPVALTAAAVTGIGVGVYSVIRGAINIYDRQKHGESMSFANSEARGAYMNIVAGTLGFVGAGATTAISQLAASGVNVGQGARVALNTIGMINIGATGVNMANSTYSVVDDWLTEQTKPSILTVVQLNSSILFFGNAVYDFNAANAVIEESKANLLKQHQESLKSNRHRRMLNKPTKETSDQTNEATNPEVISSIRNMGSANKILAILIRNNELFNDKGITFSAESGEIKLNGVSVNLLEFESITRTEKAQFLTDLSQTSQTPTSDTDNITQTMNTITIIFNMQEGDTRAKYGQVISVTCKFVNLASTLLQDFSNSIQEKVLRICKILCDRLMESIDFPNIFTNYFSHISKEPLVVILRFVMDFIKIKISSQEANYELQKAKALLSPNFHEQNFDKKWGILPTTENKVLVWFERVVNNFVTDASIDELLLRELVQYVMNIITEKVYDSCDAEEKYRKRERNTAKNPYRIACKICGGFYYSKTNS